MHELSEDQLRAVRSPELQKSIEDFRAALRKKLQGPSIIEIIICNAALECLDSAAPGLGQSVKEAIANNIGRRAVYELKKVGL